MKPFVLLLTPSTKTHTFSFLFLLAACLGAPSALAATYYWDTNDSTSGFGTAGGTWADPTTNNSTQGWSTSSAGTSSLSGTVTTTSADALNFGTGSAGLAAGTITVSGNVSSAGITFGNASGNITLTGGTITLNGSVYRIGSAATTQTINSDIVLVGARTIGLNQQNEKFIFGGNISGSGASLSVDTNATGGLITLNGTNSFSGNLTIVRGQLNISSVSDKLANSALGAGSKIIVGAAGGQGPVLNYTGNSSGSTNRDIELNVSGGGSLTITSQNAALTLSGTAFNTVANGNGILNFSGDAGGGSNISHFSGAIQDNGNSTMSVQVLAVTPAGGSLEHGFWKISGNNTYSGTTTVTNTSTLIVGHSNALGTTANGTSVAASAQLLLADGISVGAEALTLNSGAGSNWNGQTGAALRSYTGNNSWAGNITISQATIIATNSGSNLTISGGITGTNQNLTSNSVGNTILSGNITTGTGTLTKNGTGSLTLSGTNTYTGNTTINNSSGSLVIGGSGLLGGGSYAGNISIGSSSTFQYSSTANQTLSGVLSGAGALNYYSTGTLTLSGSNTMSGTLNVGQNFSTDMGTIVLQHSNAAGTKLIALNDVGTIELGTSGLTIANNITAYNQGGANTRYVRLDLAGTATGTLSGTMDSRGKLITFDVGTDDTLTLSGAVTNSSGTQPFSKSGSGTLLLTGNSSYGGTTTISAGTWEMGAAGRLGGGSYAGAISNSGTFIYSGTNAQTLSGVISGTGALTQNGSGTLTLSGANTYNGTTTINAGTLATSAANKIADTSDIVINTGGNFSLGGAETLASISGAGNIILGANTLTTNSSSSTTFSGVISGSGGLTKAGTGTLTLSGANTFNGSTTINAGTLQVDGNIASSGLVINSGGIISPGTTAAADSFGTSSITINGGGYNWTLNTANGSAGTGWDQITSTGALTSSGLLTIYAYGTPGDWDNAGSYDWDIISANSVTGFSSGNFAMDFSNFGIASGNRTGTWSFSNPSGGIIRLSYLGLTDPVWAGGTGNWDAGFSPAVSSGDAIYFTGAGGTATNNIASGTLSSLASINFQASAGAYTLAANSGSAGNGSALTVTGAITTSSSSTQTINMDVAPGSIVINSGAIQIGAAGRLNSGNYSNSITNNGTFIYSGTNNQILSGVISGTGVLTQNGSGTLTVTAYDVTQGSTVINAGTLQLNNDSGTLNWSGGTIAINNGSTLEFTGTTQTLFIGTADNVTFDSGGGGSMLLTKNPIWRNTEIITTGGAKNSISGTYFNGQSGANDVIYNTAVGTDPGGIALEVSSNHSDIGLIKNGLGTLALTSTTNNLSSRGITINSGTLEIGGAGRLGSGTYTYGITNNGTFTYNSTANQTLSGNFSGSGAIIKNASSTLTITGAVSSGVLTINGGAVVLQAPTAFAGFNGSGININNGSKVTIQGSYGFFGSKTFTFDSNGGGEMIIGSGNNVFRAAQTFTTNGGSQNIISGSYMNCDNAVTHTFNIADGIDDTDLLVSASIQNIVSIQKTGAGKMNLSATNTYSGSTTITAGTLEVSGSGNLGSGSYAGVISNNGTFSYNSTSAQTLSGVISGTGALIKGNNGTLTLSGSNTYTGTTTVSAGTLAIGNNMTIGAITGSGNLSLGSGYTLTTNASSDTTYSGVISGSGSLAKSGSGTLTLSGNNTYSGTTTINVGTLEIGAAGRLGAGTYAQNITNNGTLIYSGTNAQTLSGVISGTGALTQNASSTLTLTGSNSYSGGTTINTGTFVIGNAAAAGTGTITQSDGTSLLKFDTTGTIANAMSIYNVSANKTVTLSGGITVNNAVFDVASGETLTISNTINGTGGVTKNGTGTLVLSGNNTYSAATVINAGTLEAAHAGALGANATVTVNDGTLLVSTDDAINGRQITLNGTSTTVATLAFSSNYTGSIGKLTLSADSIIDLGQGNIGLQFADMAMGFYNLSIYNWSGTTQWGTTYGTGTDQLYFNGDYTASNVRFYSGAVGSDSFVGSGFDLGLQQTSWDSGLSGHYILPVPEPETWATALLLLLGGGLWMWKRKLKAV